MRTRPNFYSFSRRGPLLLEELKKANPDVICLQGCDQFDYFQEHLSPSGFIGIYEQTEQPKLLQNVFFGDGLAIFWRTERFKLVGRKLVVLGDDRYVSNIGLVARLKRHYPFLKPLNMDYLQNPVNIEYEGLVQIDLKNGGKTPVHLPSGSATGKLQLDAVWLVLSTKYLYVFQHRQQYHNPLMLFDLDDIMNIGDTSDDLDDYSFSITPKPKTNKESLKPIRFYTFQPAVTTKWMAELKEAQIGTSIDVWTSQLIPGYSLNAEYRRIKQCQELLEHISRVSATDHLEQCHIGHITESQEDYKESKEDEDAKRKETKSDLSERFKKLMNDRITQQKLGSTPIGGNPVDPAVPIKAKVIDPNVKPKTTRVPVIDPDAKSDDDDQKYSETLSKGMSLNLVNSVNAQNVKKEDWMSSGKWTVPTKLYRPCVLCVDIESNAWGDAMHEIPPLCYAYLTNRSRTTTQNPLYHHSLQQLMNNPELQLQRHSWFLQSAYALGLGEEPELTAFNRFWPDTGDDADHRKRSKKSMDFENSVEMVRCSDLILFSPQHFRVLKIQENMTKEWVYSRWNKSLPNADYPSDHTMVGVEFELAWKNKVRQAMEKAMQQREKSKEQKEKTPNGPTQTSNISTAELSASASAQAAAQAAVVGATVGAAATPTAMTPFMSNLHSASSPLNQLTPITPMSFQSQHQGMTMEQLLHHQAQQQYQQQSQANAAQQNAAQPVQTPSALGMYTPTQAAEMFQRGFAMSPTSQSQIGNGFR